MRPLLPALLLASAPAFAGNYATCVLDKMPEVKNDVAANAVYRVCRDKYPGEIEQGSGRGLFTYKSGAECAAKKSADTPSNRAASFIRQACMKLYDEPKCGEVDSFLGACGK